MQGQISHGQYVEAPATGAHSVNQQDFFRRADNVFLLVLLPALKSSHRHEEPGS